MSYGTISRTQFYIPHNNSGECFSDIHRTDEPHRIERQSEQDRLGGNAAG
jgi:hypothetical protein